MARCTVISVLNPAGPMSADDRVFMLATAGVDYDDPWVGYGTWRDRDEAAKECERINQMNDKDFNDYAAEIANL